MAEDKEHSIRQFRRGYRHSFKDFLLEEKFAARSVNDNNLTLGDVNKYVSSLKNSVEVWYELLNPEIGSFSEEVAIWLAKLNRLGINSYMPLILTFFKECRVDKERVVFLKAIERFGFTISLVKYHQYVFEFDETNFIDMAYKLSAAEIMPQKVIEEIHSSLDGSFQKNTLIKMMKNNLKGKEGFYGWGAIRYFLYEYELSLKEQSKVYSNKLNWDALTQDERDYKTVEHIYPQTSRARCWVDEFSECSAAEKRFLKNSLGNLVPLSKPKNSSLSNKCFHDKKSNKDNAIGFDYGCFSENEVARKEKWGADEILERGLKLVSFMERRWEINVGDKHDFLNLSFLKSSKKKKKTGK